MKFKWIKKRYLVIAVILFSISNMFLMNKNENNFNKKVMDKESIKYMPLTYEVPNVSTGLLNDVGLVEDDTIYYIDSDENFEKFINIGNFVDFKREYKLITFIDYNKEEFYVDDKLVNDFNFELDKNKDIQIPVKLPKLSKGLHDIIFAIVKDPSEDLSDEYRASTEGNHILYIRFNIVVESENSNIPNFAEVNYESIEPIPEIFLHENLDELIQFPSKTIYNNKFNAYITIGNIKNEVEECVVILMNNWEVVPINGNNNMFLKINPNEKTTIPISVDINESGLHNINAILIKNPYKKIEYGDVNIVNSIRVGVNLE